MEESLKEKFIKMLEEKYGTWDRNTSRFGNASFGRISKELSISSSQFSKFLNGTATEGMYSRGIRNVERLIHLENETQLKNKALERLDELQAQMTVLASRRKIYRILLAILFAVVASLAYLYFSNSLSSSQPLNDQMAFQHPLLPFFDRPFDDAYDSPYLSESEVLEYCPCSAYEGIWSLSAPYKLPLPGSKKPGVYYVAKSADVRMKCSKSDTLSAGKGNVLVAYEYLVNEIWVDTELTPLTPFYFNKELKQFTIAFDTLKFENNEQFKKVATIHSFFIDKFEIYKDSIERKGEPCGRFASDINHELVKTYEIDLKNVLEDVLGDLNKTDCQSSINQYCDPNKLKEGESTLSFNCMYTIGSENLGMGGGYPYTKGYLLENQNYSDNLPCDCNR